MPASDDLLRRLRATFASEAGEHLQVMNQQLLALEAATEASQAAGCLEEIFRAAHTLKGAARVVNLDAVSQVAHALEAFMGKLRNGQQAPAPATVDRLLQVLDALTELVRTGLEGAEAAVDVPGLVASLEALAEDEARPPTTSTEPKSSLQPPAEAPVELAQPPARPGTSRPAEAHGQPVDETVRIATAKLDLLLARVGELQVARISHTTRLAGLRELLEVTEQWEAEWRRGRERHRREQRPVAGPAAEPAPAAGAAGPGLLEHNEAQLKSTRARLGQLLSGLEADNRRLVQLIGDLQEEVRRTRLRPLATVLEPFPRMVRDLARELGKEVTFVIQGDDIEVDRSVLEQIKDPLMHLLRNSVDHGLEAPAARLTAGKPAAGRLRLAATQQGSSLHLEVSDDGGGVDLEQVQRQAQRLGVLTAAEAAAELPEQEALGLIFRPGFSTRSVATTVSGRGVGLDVVRQNVERLNGWVDVHSRPGQGTRFVLNVPLSVATTLCVLVRAGGQTYSVPASSVLRIVRVAPGQVRRLDGRDVILVDAQPVVVARLDELLGLSASPRRDAQRPTLVLGSAERRYAVMVDEVLGAQEVLAKGLPRPWLRVRHVAGAAILGTGEVVVVLNTADLARSAARPAAAPMNGVPAPVKAERAATIMVADDSMTTRTLEKNILEAAGYRVLLAADGQEAWTQLQTAACDLLVADVTMPRLNGFQLTEAVRADARLKHLPVVLVTSLDSREDVERGIQTGADAYIIKGAFDQDQLLATIRRLI